VDSSLHAVDFYLQQVGGYGGAMPRVDYPRGDGEFIAIHPFSGSAAKNWPLDCYRAVAASISLPVHFCAGPEETLESAMRFDDLHDLAGWLASARVYAGNDSGISHLAAAVATPVVAIFRTTDPTVWAPRGPHVIVLREPTIEEVASAIRDLC
jgi:ADP-heptose:LPS heptosyltransferase